MKPTLYLLVAFFPMLLLGCHNNNDGEQDQLSDTTDTTSYSGLTGDSVKLVKSGSVRFKVGDIGQGARAVSGITKRLGGIVYNQSLEYAETERNELKISSDSLLVVTVSMPEANMTVRVPSEHLEEYMYAVADLGYFTSSSELNIDDRSLAYLENNLKHKARIQTLSGQTVRKGRPLTERQSIRARDEAVEQEIANRGIDADVNFSVVRLSLFQSPLVRKEIISNYTISSYQLPFSQRIGNSLRDGWQYFLSFVLVLANLWVFLLVGLAALISYRHLQAKRRLKGIGLKPS